MTRLTVSHPDSILHGTIRLPGSKSISNRALILQQASNIPFIIENISAADDTVIMQQALQQHSGTLHLKNAGTCMRFLTAYFAAKENTSVTLLCDERMEQRPIKELVDALRQLGADITYLHTEGFPPLRINGKTLTGGTIQLSAAASSQYVSALMMIAPLCEKGLTIQLTGNITSLPYIEMTARMMMKLGLEVLIKHEERMSIEVLMQIQKHRTSNAEINPNTLTPISKGSSTVRNFFIEADWSAASYWYEMAALSKGCDILLEGLTLDSLQGDAVIGEYMKRFGVVTIVEQNGIRLRKEIRIVKSEIRNTSEISNPKSGIINLTSSPDLAPALAITAAALNIPVHFTGLKNLAIKESNRLEALQTELTKLGFNIAITEDELVVLENGTFEIRNSKFEKKTHTNPDDAPNQDPKSQIRNPKYQLRTYGDHRMAMAFAPLALVMEAVVIENPEVVEKSYPHFWEDLKMVRFRQEMG